MLTQALACVSFSTEPNLVVRLTWCNMLPKISWDVGVGVATVLGLCWNTSEFDWIFKGGEAEYKSQAVDWWSGWSVDSCNSSSSDSQCSNGNIHVRMILSLLKLKLKSQQRRRPLLAGTAQTHSDASQVGCHPVCIWQAHQSEGLQPLHYGGWVLQNVHGETWPYMNDESMYSAEAELCSVMWCQFPSPVPFLELEIPSKSSWLLR